MTATREAQFNVFSTKSQVSMEPQLVAEMPSAPEKLQIANSLPSTSEQYNLIWCSDCEFDAKVNHLSVSAVLDLVQALQEAMVLEQQTFDSLRQQLAQAATNSEAHERLSTALCSSQARLARLCARNMRCFMQAVRAKQTTPVMEVSPSEQSPITSELAPGSRSRQPQRGSEDDTGTEEGEEEDEEGSEEGSGSSGFHSLPRPPRKAAPVAPQLDVTSHEEKQQQHRVPSVDEILCSVKRLRSNHTAMVKSALKCPPTAKKTGHVTAIVDNPSEDMDSPFYENVVLLNGKSTSPSLIYENVGAPLSEPQHIYDKPRANIYAVPHHAALEDEDIEAVYENIHFATGKKSSDNELSDDSTVYENIEPIGKKQAKHVEVTYDVPLNSSPIHASVSDKSKVSDSLLPQSTRMLLSGSRSTGPGEADVDQDSLEDVQGTEEADKRSSNDSDSEPDIPSPDYGSEEDEEGEFCCDDLPSLQDEADSRAYYSEDQGLAVILEEPEEEEERSSSSAASSDCSPWPATASSSNESGVAGEEEAAVAAEGAEQDRVLDAYKETVRQRFARTRLADVVFTAPSSADAEKSDDAKQNGCADETDGNVSPSVRDLRSHFEVPLQCAAAGGPLMSRCSSNGHSSAATAVTSGLQQDDVGDYVEPIFTQFAHVNTEEEIHKPRPTTRSWDPSMLLRDLYSLPETFKSSSPPTQCCVTIEGYLEKLPSGKKKATFWNAWKRRYFRAKDGFLYYYQNNHCEKPSMTLQLMGGKVDSLESSILGVEDRQAMVSTMLGIDDGKGHYVVVRCASKQETERWRLALMTHIAENFTSTYVHPWPIPKDPALIKDTIIIDLGSSSIRAGILCTQPSLPQLFFPTIMAIDKLSKKRSYGGEALRPEVRATSTLHYPVRPSAKITKYSVDLTAVVGFLQKIFQDLNVDQKLYDVILSVPRSFNASTQTEILNILFDQFGVRAVNMTHQSVLALYAYNATSGIVVDIGERMDIVPISDGYIVENGVSRIPYGGTQIVDHLRHFLMQKQYSLVTEVESLLIRYILENMCYCAQQYNSELNKCRQDPASVEDSISIKEFFDNPLSHWETITLDSGRFQPTEGLFSPDAWGLDNPGVHKMVHRAIQECSMDVRKEMTRSIYLSGGVTMLPGFAERLHIEIDKVTPTALVPKVHTSPYRYHAAFLGACVLANSPGVDRMKITFQEWNQAGCSALKKWTL